MRNHPQKGRTVFGIGGRLVGAVILMLVVAGCRQQEGDYLGGLPDPELIAQLEERAHDLAQRQYQYFEAYERQNRDEVRFHELIGQPFTGDDGVYLKDYRNFIGYTVDDIRRTDSYRTPVEIEITYFYEWRITPPRSSDLGKILLDLDPKLVAENDNEFSTRDRLKMTRRYPCDSRGEFFGSLEEPLPLENFYFEVGEKTENTPAFEFASQ